MYIMGHTMQKMKEDAKDGSMVGARWNRNVHFYSSCHSHKLRAIHSTFSLSPSLSCSAERYSAFLISPASGLSGMQK